MNWVWSFIIGAVLGAASVGFMWRTSLPSALRGEWILGFVRGWWYRHTGHDLSVRHPVVQSIHYIPIHTGVFTDDQVSVIDLPSAAKHPDICLCISAVERRLLSDPEERRHRRIPSDFNWYPEENCWKRPTSNNDYEYL